MFKIYLSRTVNPGVDISLPTTIEKMREAYSPPNRTGTVPLGTVTAYVESSIPNLRQYLYEVLVSEKRLEELSYLAYRVKWMDSQDEAILGTMIETMKLETLQNIISLPYNTDKFRYLPGTTTEAELGECLLKGYLSMTMEEQTVRSNYEWIEKDYIRKHDDIFHVFGYTSGVQEELEFIYGGNELPDPGFKRTCSFKVWTYKGNPYDNHTLTLLAAESKTDALKSAMGISNWSEYKQLDIQYRVSTLQDWLPEHGSIRELNGLVIEYCQNIENQQIPVLEM